MLSRWRVIPVVTIGAVAISAPLLASATAESGAKTIKTTQRIIALSLSARSVHNVGTTDGKIAGSAVHGALRATATRTSPSFAAHGTLFYPKGTLRYRLAGRLTIHSDDSFTETGKGKFKGGTGAYKGAHGRFKISGARPAHSDVVTYTLKGKVFYR
jgi:hypothetical protein